MRNESLPGSRAKARDQQLRGAMTTPQPSPSTTPSARHTSFTFKAVVLAIPLIVSLAIFGVIFRARAREIAQIEKQLDYEKERGAKLEVVAYR
jgi:hypothetical protein